MLTDYWPIDWKHQVIRHRERLAALTLATTRLLLHLDNHAKWLAILGEKDKPVLGKEEELAEGFHSGLPS